MPARRRWLSGLFARWTPARRPLSRHRLTKLVGLEILEDRSTPAAGPFGAVAAAADFDRDGVADLVTAPTAGGGPVVNVFDGATGGLRRTFLAYAPNDRGGVDVAAGDVDGDGTPDVITGAAAGAPHVKVFSGRDGRELRSFYAFDPALTSGVSVAAGDVDGDGRADIIAGSGNRIRVFGGRDAAVVLELTAFTPELGGLSVAAGDVDGDGRADVIAGAGPGGGSHVRVFRGADGAELRSFYAFEPGYTGGVDVAAGDVDGDGRADVVLGARGAGGPHVRVVGADGRELRSFYAFDPGYAGGVTVAAGDLDGDGRADVIAAAARGAPHVRGFAGPAGAGVVSFYAFGPAPGFPPVSSPTSVPPTPAPPPAAPVALAAGLANDTGPAGPNADGLTSDPTVRGVAAPPAGVVRFGAGFGASEPAVLVNLLPDLGPDGRFVLPPARLDQIAGGPLPDGRHTLHLRAVDARGVAATARVEFTLDRAAPAAPAFDLSAGSDTDAAGDRRTAAARVTLVGHTDPLTAVTLSTGAVTVSDAAGAFHFPDVDLAAGANPLTAAVADAAGNAATFSGGVERTGAVVSGDAVLDWNQTLLDAIRLDASAPPVAARNMALVQGAVYDAVSAVEGTPGYFARIAAPAGAAPAAAVAAAAHRVLSYLYPAQQPAFDAALAASLAAVPAGQSRDDGAVVGRAAADAVIALRAGDGWDTFIDHVPGAGPGAWQPTPPLYAPGLLPQWAALRPFAMTSPDQFAPAGPPDLASPEWAAAYNEVRLLGAAAGSPRTPEQTQIARFWADGGGTYTPPGHWNRIAAQVAREHGNSLTTNARLFAQLGLALADAAVASWNVKYRDGFWRPVTAIRAGDTDGNPATAADPTWTPLLVTPPFPEYVSGHSTFSGAAAAVLTAAFGDAVSFTTDSVGLPGVQRTFGSFTAAADEAGLSRIYGGIHYSFSNIDGLATGRAVGEHVLSAFSVAADTRPPAVTFADRTPARIVSGNVTIAGAATDNLSGVRAVEVQADGGAWVNMPLDAAGRFTLPTAFALDGTADGRHALAFRATDHAGNVSAPVEFAVTLDTAAPTVGLAAPDDGGAIAAGARLTGVASGTGSDLTALAYSFDGGVSVPVLFDPATGGFDQLLDLSRLAPGGHTLAVTARDAAGHTTTVTRAVSLAARVTLTVTGHTPADGADEVGATYRPRVTFSRPIDPATLTAANFYATDTTGAAIPATITPAADGSFAWLFFQAPLPGASSITVTVDGSTIRDAAGTPLDAAGTGTPGSALTFHFRTVSLTGLPGTVLTGIVADPGPDLKPMTFDDVRAGADATLMTADDVYVRPLAGVRVFILGQEHEAVYTDATGRFTFPAAPSGNVKLAVDGRTATNAPAGVFFPEMVMDLTLDPGRVNTVMGSMGTREANIASDAVHGVELPRLETAILHDVDPAAVTTVGVTAGSAPNLTAEQRPFLTLSVQPGSLIGPDGLPVAAGQVGISTVPPEMVRDMLPPGQLQHAFDITVQAPGITNFSVPAPMTFPNWSHAAPGTVMNFMSFDHTTGRMEIEGTATVSADGLSVTTDPGYGITHPGWHFVQVGTNFDGLPCVPNEVCVQVNDGFLGDVIEVNLSGTGGREFELAAGSFPSQHGFIAAVDNWASLLRDNGRFYFVPTFPDTDARFTQAPKTFDLQFSAIGRLATDPPDAQERRLPFRIQFKEVKPGYTGNGPNSVQGNADKLGIYQIQQRLKWLGFPGSNGNPGVSGGTPLQVDGVSGNRTKWAIGLFNHAVAATNPSSSDADIEFPNTTLSSDSAVYINANNAPRWVEFQPGTGFKINPNLTPPGPQLERWGTSWALEVLTAAGARYSAASGGQQMGFQGASVRAGGQEYHSTHEAGMDIDVDVPESTDGAGTPWYKLRGGYVAASTGSDDVVWRHSAAQGGGYFGFSRTPTPTNPAPAGATRVLHDFDGVYDNPTVLRAIHAQGLFVRIYDTEDIRRQINSFRNIATDSGAGVSSILFNDPLFWSDPSGTTGFVIFTSGHAGHFHVNVAPPQVPVTPPPNNPFGGGGSSGPTLSSMTSTAAGFGSDPSLYYHFRLANGFEVNGRSNPMGAFNVVLTPNTDYTLTAYQASTNKSAIYHGRSSPSGAVTSVGVVILDQFGGPDADGDGLPDVGERAIGTSPSKRDTDGDGVSDDAEIAQGLDPLDGRAFATGVVANVPLLGEPTEIVVHGTDGDGRGQIAYVATGNYGLAIVDVGRFDRPTVLGQLDLPGTATDVALNPLLGLAAVAGGAGGLHVVDVSDPLAPRLVRTVPVGATRVDVIGGTAYCVVGSMVVGVDLLTGEVVDRFVSPENRSITDVTHEGDELYTVDFGNRLRVFGTAGAAMVPRGSLVLPSGGGKLFVGNGIAYVAAANNRRGGFSTVDVRDPDAPVLISGPDSPEAPNLVHGPRTAVVNNGSGLALLVGREQQVFGSQDVLRLLVTTDPTNTDDRALDVVVRGVPNGIAVASGIAFVVGTGGLTVVNYLPFDNRGQAPGVTLSATAADIDPATGGLQVFSGTTIPVRADITDDVQVRNVELLLDSVVVANDVSFPFELAAVAPGFGTAAGSVTLQLRATDTGGNVTLSAPLVVGVTPEQVAPTLVSVTPANGDAVPEGLRTVRVRFSEPMAAGTVTASTLTLAGPGGPVPPVDVELLDDGREVKLTYPALPAAEYTLTIDATAVTDRAGNALGGAPALSRFTLVTPSTLTVVTTTADDGPGSLRQALAAANASATPVVIDFRIPATDPNFVDVDAPSGGDAAPDVFVISPLSPLPALTNTRAGIRLDGRTQAAFGGDTNPSGPEIVLDGSLAGAGADGVVVLTANHAVSGLIVQNFQGHGVHVVGGATARVTGNFIGTDATGRLDRGNGGDGVRVAAGARGVVVGTDGDGSNDAAEGNLIAFNRGAGVAVVGDDTGPVTVRRNAIRTLGVSWQPGIDLGGDGPSPTDPGDTDTGPNGLLNAPEVSVVLSTPNGFPADSRFTGVVRAAPLTAYIVDFYRQPFYAQNALAAWVETVTVTTDATGRAEFSARLPVGLQYDDFVTATITDPAGNTSEPSGGRYPLVPGTLERNDTLATANPTEPSPLRTGQYRYYGTIGNHTLGEPAGTDVDTIYVDLDAGDRLVMDVDHRLATSLIETDTVLRLFDAAGNQLAVSDNDPAPGEEPGLSPYVDFTAPAAGRYYLAVSGRGNEAYDPRVPGTAAVGQAGDYDYTVAVATPDPADPGNTLGTATDLGPAPPASITGILGDNPAGDPRQDVDVYAVRFPSYAPVIVRLDPTQLSPTSSAEVYLLVFNEFGVEMAGAYGRTSTGEWPEIELWPSADTTYYIVVSGSIIVLDPQAGGPRPDGSMGSYTISLTSYADPEENNTVFESIATGLGGEPVPGAATFAGTIGNSVWQSGRDVDVYSVYLYGGWWLRADVDARFADPVGLDSTLVLFRFVGGSGDIVEVARSADDPAPGEEASGESYLDYTAVDGGWYYLALCGAGNEPDPLFGGTAFGSSGQYDFAIAVGATTV
jgi:membrane-associated phospholipid phosphatase